MRLSTQDPPIRTRVGQFDSALLRYAARLARRVEQGRSAYYSGSDTRARSCARHVSQLDAMAIGSWASAGTCGLDSANNWGAFVAVLIPTTVAAWCEGQPVGSFGLPWRGGADGYVPRASPGASVPRAYRNPLQLTAFLVTGLLA